MAPKAATKGAGKAAGKKTGGLTGLQTADYLEPEPVMLHVGHWTAVFFSWRNEVGFWGLLFHELFSIGLEGGATSPCLHSRCQVLWLYS